MGFRNPVTSASDVSTAATGPRIVVRGNTVSLYSGDPAETRPGEVYSGITPGLSGSGGDQPFIYVHPPSLDNSFPGNGITVSGKSRDGSAPGATTISGALSATATPVDLPLAVGWSWLGAGYGKPKVYADAAGATHVQGYISRTGASITTASLVANLPPGYAPKNGVHTTYLQTTGFDWCRVDVGTDGTITITAYNASGISTGNYFALNLTFHPNN